MAGRSDVLAAVRSMHNVLGGTLDPHAAYLLLRGLKTLDLRVSRQNATAMEVSRRLEAHPKVSELITRTASLQEEMLTGHHKATLPVALSYEPATTAKICSCRLSLI